MTKMLTQYEEIKRVWMNALTQFRVEELLLHFPPGKFGFAEDADMTPIEGVVRFIDSVKKARTDLATMEVHPAPSTDETPVESDEEPTKETANG
jgi:hypothetical protein